jgi:hypothetical protein
MEQEAREPDSRHQPPQGEPRRSDLLTIALLVFFVALVLTVAGLLLAAQIWPDVFT